MCPNSSGPTVGKPNRWCSPAHMRLFRLLALIGLISLAVLGFWTAPDQQAASLSSSVRVGERSNNLLYFAATRGFDVVRVDSEGAKYVRGKRRGEIADYFSQSSFPYGNRIEDVCQGDNCVFYAAERIDKPFGPESKFSHTYRIGWVERDRILQAVGADNSFYFYPIK